MDRHEITTRNAGQWYSTFQELNSHVQLMAAVLDITYKVFPVLQKHLLGCPGADLGGKGEADIENILGIFNPVPLGKTNIPGRIQLPLSPSDSINDWKITASARN